MCIYSTSVTSEASSSQFYLAVAQLTIGAQIDGQNLVFFQGPVGAECGTKLEYTVVFNYGSPIPTPDDCLRGPNNREWFDFGC